MAYAYVTKEGNIRMVVNKVSPFERLQEGERLVPYPIPEYDIEVYDIKPVTPCLSDVIEFVVTIKPQALDVLKKRKAALVQKVLDSKAKENGYDSILSAVSYAALPQGPFYQESVKFLQWRDACWVTCFALLDSMGKIEDIPSDEEFVALLPKIQL